MIVVLYAFGRRRSAAVRYLLAALAAAALLTLGTGLVVKGSLEFSLPWRVVARLPILTTSSRRASLLTRPSPPP